MLTCFSIILIALSIVQFSTILARHFYFLSSTSSIKHSYRSVTFNNINLLPAIKLKFFTLILYSSMGVFKIFKL